MAKTTVLMNTAQVCAFFSIVRRTLDNWIAFQTIPTGFILGGRRYWREADLVAFVDKEVQVRARGGK